MGWGGGGGKVGNLAGSQACPLGLLMPSFPGHTSAHLGCENGGKGGDIKKGKRWKDSSKGGT